MRTAAHGSWVDTMNTCPPNTRCVDKKSGISPPEAAYFIIIIIMFSHI